MCERRNQRVSATSTYCACVQHFESQDAVALAAIRDMLAWQGPYFVREREREREIQKEKEKARPKIFTSDKDLHFRHGVYRLSSCLNRNVPSWFPAFAAPLPRAVGGMVPAPNETSIRGS